MRIVGRVGKMLGAVVAMVAIALGVVIFGYAKPNAAKEVDLPSRTGPDAVGRMIFDWTDSVRIDPYSPHHLNRELSVWVWYPARPKPGASPGPYIRADWLKKLAAGATTVDTLNGLVATSPDAIHAHAVDDAPIIQTSSPIPVLIFEPGLGFASYEYAAVAEDLASHGYIVAGVNPTYSATTIIGGRLVHSTAAAGDNADPDALVKLWAADMKFVTEKLLAQAPFRAHSAHVQFFGHSIGGAAALAACRDETLCDSAADLDGDLAGDLASQPTAKPMLFLGHDHVFSEEPGLKSQLAAAARGTSYVYTVKGTAHRSFSDRAMAFNLAVGWLGGDTATIEPARGLAITAGMLEAFYSNALPNGASAYPELVSANSTAA